MATIKKTVYEPVDAGIYLARVDDVVVEEGQFGQQLKWHFGIQEPGLEDKTLIGWCSATFSPKSKLWSWSKALLFGGREIPDYFDEIDTQKFIGTQAQLVVAMERGNDGTLYNRIKDVLPVRTQQPAARMAPAPAPAPAPAGNGGGVVSRQTPRQPLTAASAAGVATQRVVLGASNPAEPPDWPGWDEAAVEPLVTAGPYDAELAF